MIVPSLKKAKLEKFNDIHRKKATDKNKISRPPGQLIYLSVVIKIIRL